MEPPKLAEPNSKVCARIRRGKPQNSGAFANIVHRNALGMKERPLKRPLRLYRGAFDIVHAAEAEHLRVISQTSQAHSLHKLRLVYGAHISRRFSKAVHARSKGTQMAINNQSLKDFVCSGCTFLLLYLLSTFEVSFVNSLSLLIRFPHVMLVWIYQVLLAA